MSLCSSPSFRENWVSFSLMRVLFVLLFEQDRRSSRHIIEDYINPRVSEFVLFVSVGESPYVSSVGEHVGYSSVGECV